MYAKPMFFSVTTAMLAAMVLMAITFSIALSSQTEKFLKDIASVEIAKPAQSYDLDRERRQRHLRQEMSSAMAKIRDLVDGSTSGSESERQQLALNLLRTLRYDGGDGYFYVYSTSGYNLAHPFHPEFVGTYKLDMTDDDGAPVIKQLIEAARSTPNGGFETFKWPKPSSGQTTRKLSYNVLLPEWDWVIGTGLYLNDVEVVKSRIGDKSVERFHGVSSGLNVFAAVVALLLLALTVIRRISSTPVATQNDAYMVFQTANNEVRSFLTAAHHMLKFVRAGKCVDQTQLNQVIERAANHLETADTNLVEWSRALIVSHGLNNQQGEAN